MLSTALAFLWRALKGPCEYLFAAFLGVWFWFLGPIVYIFVVVILMLLLKLYRIAISYPSKIFRRCFFQVSQLMGQTNGLLFHSLGVAHPYYHAQGIIWMTLESSVADHLALAVRSTCTSFRLIGTRIGEWLGLRVVTFLFFIPRQIWMTIFVIFASLFMLGGGGTAYLIYGISQAAHRDSFGLDFLDEQRLKLEKNNPIYQPLVSGQIRVLYLHPGSPGSHIRCELMTTELGVTQYEALSYVWGNPTMDRSIYLNGEKAWVTRNLHRALAHLRCETKPRVLWVDALCINQIDIKEREAQVSQMCDIYTFATRVVVWLNTAPFGIKQAFQTVQSDNPPSKYHFGTARVVSKLLASPWWMRVWVVQEFIVAKAVIIQCSNHTLEWDAFCRLIDSAIQIPCFTQSGTYLEEYRALKEQRLSRTLNASGNDLLELLFAFRMKHATDPRDKIFAFLSLCGTQDDDSTVIRADYVKKPEEVFKDCAVKLINSSKSLSILALTECVESSFFRREQTDRFTWCPQWAGHGNSFRVTPFWTGRYNYNQSWASAQFSAAGGIPTPPCLITNDIIRLSGWEADEVVAVGQTADISYDELIDVLGSGAGSSPVVPVLDALRHWEKVLPQWEDLAEARTLPSCDTTATRKAFYTTITAGIYRNKTTVDFHDNDLMSIIKAASYGRTFFVTASGLFGLGPGGTALGDKVYILLGSDVPVILRQAPASLLKLQRHAATLPSSGDPVSVSHQLYLGQAYVDKLMTYQGDLRKDIDEGRQVVDYVYLV